MCGIAGFLPGKNNPDLNKQILQRMLTRIKHRGPDESGAYLSEKVVLGSVRLSIIDLKSGTMPMASNDQSKWIVFNGEIFNYIELRETLIQKGYQFNTASDTEVVVNLYQEFGADFLNMLNGQFALAIWDKDTEELVLARDRVGIRPLFYTKVGENFIFASEIKAFLEYPGIDFNFSAESLSEYFTFWTTLTPKTVFKDIYEVSPGSFLKIKKGKIKTEQYWELPVIAAGDYEITDLEEAKAHFDRLFTDAVKIRLRADVPVAAYLSGGIDSSITTAYIKKIQPENLQTFSIGFPDKDFDESEYQDLAVNYFITKHSGITCDAKAIAGEFKDTVWHAEAPVLRTSPVPMRILAGNVRRHNIKVVITGEGSDELFGGYNIFKETKIRHFWAKDPESKYRPLLLRRLYPYLPQMNRASSNMLKMFFGYKLTETQSPVYSHLLRWNNTSRISNYLSENLKNEIKDYDPVSTLEQKLKEDFKDLDSLSKAQKLEIDLFMSGYLLSSQGDRMAMSHSVEGRYPFLDHRLIEFAMRLHPDLKLKILNEKYLLKKLMKNKLPEAILNRSKQAYRAPIKNVLLGDDAPRYLKDQLSEDRIRVAGIFNFEKVKLLLKKYTINKQISEIDNMALTGILSVQILHDLFIQRSVEDLTGSDLIHFDKIIKERST